MTTHDKLTRSLHLLEAVAACFDPLIGAAEPSLDVELLDALDSVEHDAAYDMNELLHALHFLAASDVLVPSMVDGRWRWKE